MKRVGTGDSGLARRRLSPGTCRDKLRRGLAEAYRVPRARRRRTGTRLGCRANSSSQVRIPALTVVLALALFSASSTVFTQPALPQLTAPVNDFANVIDGESERELDRRIRALHQATGDVVAVATVPSLEGFADINELAVRMFENGGRGIGQKGKDNGALLVVALKERQVRIEVGYDLEEFITDGFAGDTIREAIVPRFRNGEYGPGVLAGATRVINRVAQRRGVELENVPRERQPIATPPQFNAWPLIIVAWVLLMMLTNRRRRRRGRWGRGPWSGWDSGVGPFGGGMGGFGGGFGGFGGGGGSGGGGFGGFGGGRSGGGGASGSW